MDTTIGNIDVPVDDYTLLRQRLIGERRTVKAVGRLLFETLAAALRAESATPIATIVERMRHAEAHGSESSIPGA